MRSLRPTQYVLGGPSAMDIGHPRFGSALTNDTETAHALDVYWNWTTPQGAIEYQLYTGVAFPYDILEAPLDPVVLELDVVSGFAFSTLGSYAHQLISIVPLALVSQESQDLSGLVAGATAMPPDSTQQYGAGYVNLWAVHLTLATAEMNDLGAPWEHGVFPGLGVVAKLLVTGAAGSGVILAMGAIQTGGLQSGVVRGRPRVVGV